MNVADYNALARTLRDNLELIKRNLEIAHSGIVTAAGALKEQRCGCDPDVAEVLQHFVGNEVYRQIERTETLLELLDPTAVAIEPGAGLDKREVLQ